jgi:hypothetical protein
MRPVQRQLRSTFRNQEDNEGKSSQRRSAFSLVNGSQVLNVSISRNPSVVSIPIHSRSIIAQLVVAPIFVAIDVAVDATSQKWKTDCGERNS